MIPPDEYAKLRKHFIDSACEFLDDNILTLLQSYGITDGDDMNYINFIEAMRAWLQRRLAMPCLLQAGVFDKPESLKPIFKEDDIITDGETSLIILDVDKENQRYHVHEINDGTTWLLPFSSQTTWKIDK